MEQWPQAPAMEAEWMSEQAKWVSCKAEGLVFLQRDVEPSVSTRLLGARGGRSTLQPWLRLLCDPLLLPPVLPSHVLCSLPPSLPSSPCTPPEVGEYGQLTSRALHHL